MDMEEKNDDKDIDAEKIEDMDNMDIEKNGDMENINEMNEGKNEEMDMDNMENMENNEEGEGEMESHRLSKSNIKDSKRKSFINNSKILKTNSRVYDDDNLQNNNNDNENDNDNNNENDNDNNNENENNNDNENDDNESMQNEKMDDLVMEEIEEIKDENTKTHMSNINKTSQTLKSNKTSESKIKEMTSNSIKTNLKNKTQNSTTLNNQQNKTNRTREADIDKPSSHYIGGGEVTGGMGIGGSGSGSGITNTTKNKINISQTTLSYQKESKSRKNETLNLNDDLNKINKNLYESVQDNSRNEKSVSLQKLTNIPAACEIEEYDFLFIDLEEFIHFHTNGFHLFELAEFMKKISTENKKPRIVLNYPNILINLNVVNLEILQTLMDIMSYTDIFLFEKKECLAFFNMLSQMNYEKDLNDKLLNDFFFKEIPHHKNTIPKVGLFLEDLQKFNIAEQKNGKNPFEITYDINLHPKINHFNQKIIEEYKKIIAVNNSYFKSIFFGGYFSSYVFNYDYFQSFKSGAESTKRILEIFKNKIDFPTDPEFYSIKLQKKKIEKDLYHEKLRKKENNFKLDCINKTNSSIKNYNPLFDDHLNAFFANSIIRKQLKEKGFINTNGFVLYDSSYKGIVDVPPKHKKRLDTSERERHLLLAIKQNKVN